MEVALEATSLDFQGREIKASKSGPARISRVGLLTTNPQRPLFLSLALSLSLSPPPIPPSPPSLSLSRPPSL